MELRRMLILIPAVLTLAVAAQTMGNDMIRNCLYGEASMQLPCGLCEKYLFMSDFWPEVAGYNSSQLFFKCFKPPSDGILKNGFRNYSHEVFQYEGHVVTSPHSWYRFWYSSPRVTDIGMPKAVDYGSDYTYEGPKGPNLWSVQFPTCNGTRQSPINLDVRQMQTSWFGRKIYWMGYGNEPQNMTVTNKGYTIEVTANWDTTFTPLILVDGLAGAYVFAQLHFHWGDTNANGSEHTLNNQSFAMEMHVVHYKKEYATFENAIKKPDGIVVVAIFFEAREKSNDVMEQFLQVLPSIRGTIGLNASIQALPLNRIFRPFFGHYMRYFGSLTTPPCSESVTWLVSAKPMYLSMSQMQQWRNNVDLRRNIRPLQERNGRLVFYVAKKWLLF